jgi:hypothetical protein
MFVYYPIEPYTDIVTISGQRMAQPRRMGKRNQRADRPKAPRFSPYRIEQDHADRSPRPLAPFHVSPRILMLTRMGNCRIPGYFH